MQAGGLKTATEKILPAMAGQYYLLFLHGRPGDAVLHRQVYLPHCRIHALEIVPNMYTNLGQR